MRFSTAMTIVATALTVAAPAFPQSVDEGTRAAARVIGEEGLALFAQGDYAGALARFDRAEALVAVPTLGVRAGRCLEKLGRWVEASERYLRTTTLAIDPTLPELYRNAQAQAQAQAHAERAALLPRIPTLDVVVEGAAPDEVTVDGVALPAALVGEKRPIDPGEHVVRARAGSASAEERVNVAESANARVVLKLAASPAQAAFSPAPPGQVVEAPAARASAPPWRTIGWVGVGVGAAGIVTGVVTLGLALDRKAELEAAGCGSGSCPREAALEGIVEGDVDTYNALATTSTVALVSSGVIGAAGVVLLLAAPRSVPAKRGAVVVPVLSATPRGAFAGARASF